MDEQQTPFDEPRRTDPAREDAQDRKRGRIRPDPPNVIGIPIALGATGLVIAVVAWKFSMGASQTAFQAVLAENVGLLMMALAALTAAIMTIRSRVVAAVVLLLAAVGFGYYGVRGIADWTLDQRDGVRDATAAVMSLELESSDEGDFEYYRLTVRMPEGGSREWNLSKELAAGWEPRVGDEVDVTYYPRTDVLTSLSR